MLSIDVISNPIYDGLVIELDTELDGLPKECQDFDTFVSSLVECSDGAILQRWKDVVLFQIEGVERVYGVCRDEYHSLILRDHVELKAFTMKEYEQFNKMIAMFGDLVTDYIC